VVRVLQPGGVFLFAEEWIKRMLSLRLYRAAYYNTMKPWEKRLHQWGLLGFVVRDAIGAQQEENFGIRQNYSMRLRDWDAMVRKYFVAQEYELFVPRTGWGERSVRNLAIRLDPNRSEWLAARLLGGTIAAVCRKAGTPPPSQNMDHFETLLRCPDCQGPVQRDSEILSCSQCGYRAANEDGVYTLLPSKERDELYPGAREDIVDFSQPDHERHLREGWHDVEGVFGNKYRWIGGRAVARLGRVANGPQQLRIRCFTPEHSVGCDVKAIVNGTQAGAWKLDRKGVLVLEAAVPDASEYLVEIQVSPVRSVDGDDRELTINISMMRLVPAI
jgi:hypothetical protein